MQLIGLMVLCMANSVWVIEVNPEKAMVIPLIPTHSGGG